jgi:hypothetical protein
MPKTDAQMTAGTEQGGQEVEDSLRNSLDEWRAKVDELNVQIDLAKLGLRDEATKRAQIVQNALLAATSTLRRAREDASGTVTDVQEGVEKLIHDLEEAIRAAAAVIARG